MEKTIVTSSEIPIHFYSNCSINGFALSLFVRAGSMFENEAENGSSHLFEHIVFRHLNRIYKGRFYELLDSCALSFDATTGVKCVEFTVSGAAKHFRTAAEILSNIFLPLSLTNAELIPERNRIKAEIREEDNASTLEHFSDLAVWKDTSLSHTVSGSAPSIDRMGIRYLKALQCRLLSAENVFFYAAGCITEADARFLCSLMEERKIHHAPKRGNIAPVPHGFLNRPTAVHIKNAPYTSVKLCFDCPVGAQELPALYLLWDMLFGGETALLHRRLSEDTGLIYSFDGAIDVYDNLSLFSLVFEIRHDKLYAGVSEALSAFATLSEQIESRLYSVLPAYTDNAPLLLDSPASMISTFAYENHILGQGFSDIDARKRAFISVTPQRLRELAELTFRAKNLTLALKCNKSKTDEARLCSLFSLLK